MVAEFFSKLFEVLPKKAAPIALAGLFLLVLPTPLSEGVGFEELRREYRPWIFLITVLSSSFTVYDFGTKAVLSLRTWRSGRRRRAQVLEQLQYLSEKETDLLLALLVLNQRTIHLPISSPVAHSLTHKNLLVRASGVGDITAWPYTVPGFVWDELLMHFITEVPLEPEAIRHARENALVMLESLRD